MLDATADLPHNKKSLTAILIMTGAILVAAFGILPIAVSAVVGVLLMIAVSIAQQIGRPVYPGPVIACRNRATRESRQLAPSTGWLWHHAIPPRVD